jgi:hypothetical protein
MRALETASESSDADVRSEMAASRQPVVRKIEFGEILYTADRPRELYCIESP